SATRPSSLPRRARWDESLVGRPIPPVSLVVSDGGLPRLITGSAPPLVVSRGLLNVHSRYGLSTRCTAMRCICLEGFDGFVTSTAASMATGWSDPVCRVGVAPTED